MIFTKDPKLKYTDMAIFFDNNFWTIDGENCRDDNKCYMYLYLIYHMLACRGKYFHKYTDYDLFASFAATTIYMRFMKKDARGERIKSVLNYAKSSVYPLKIMFQREAFEEVINKDVNPNVCIENITNNLKDAIQQDYTYGFEEEVERTINQLPSLIKNELAKSPYKNQSLMCHKLYMSCLLTFLNSITLRNEFKEKLKRKRGKTLEREMFVLLQQERESCVILWHLESKYRNYVTLLYNKVRNKFSDELESTKHYFELSDDALNTILLSAYESHSSSYEETMEDFS